MIRTLAVLVVASLVPACANHLYYEALLPSPRPLASRPIESVEIFVVSPPTRPHVTVGLMQVLEGNDRRGTQTLIADLRGLAAQTGCDALLITSIDHQRSRYRDASVEGACIVYRQPLSSNDDPGQSPSPVSTAPEKQTAVVRGVPLEVRTGPFIVAPLFARVPEGGQVSVSAIVTKGWRQVKLPDGRVGYTSEAALGRASP